ncbi:MAG: DUF3307 domain-containing protein [Pseudomonadota bacterium]
MVLTPIQFLFALFIVFQIKQLLADYVFQTIWMVNGKGRAGAGFIFPLFVHVFLHASLTLAIVAVIDPSLWYLAVVDFAVHFVIDRLKSGPRWFGRIDDPSRQAYWALFGLDQMAHHLTHYAIIWVIFSNRF